MDIWDDFSSWKVVSFLKKEGRRGEISHLDTGKAAGQGQRLVKYPALRLDRDSPTNPTRCDALSN
jgi:hypothetical protein